MLDKNYRKAATVLAVLEELYGDRLDGNVETYRNGRENGFGIDIARFRKEYVDGSEVWQRVEHVSKWRTVYVAEFRRSDGIVVYVVDKMTQGELTEEAYENAKHFGPTAFTAAAKYIWNQLTAKSQWDKDE